MIDPTNSASAFIIIDVQNDFCPGGALAVSNGDQVVDPINRISSQFSNIILTQDWHPTDHVSFAANQSGKEPYQTIALEYGDQTLWPSHCIQGSEGAAFHSRLNTDKAQLVIRKGFRSSIDSYSAFFENDQLTTTGLHGYLQDRGITQVMMCGLATDFCVAWSALDAVKLGYQTTVVLEGCAAIDLGGSLDMQLSAMNEVGVNILDTW